MRTGLTISSAVHASALLWAVLTFGANPLESAPSEFAADRHHLHHRLHPDDAGAEDGEEAGNCKAAGRARRRAQAGPEPVQKITERKEIEATRNEPKPPVPEEKPDPKPEQKPEPPSRAEGGRQARAEAGTEDRSDRRGAGKGRQEAEEGRAEEADRGAAGADAAEEAAGKAATEIRSLEDFGAARQARSAASGRDRRHHQPHRLARRADRQCRDAVAERDRCTARADPGLLESAARLARFARSGRAGAPAAQPRRQRFGRAAGAQSRQPPAIPGRAPKRPAAPSAAARPTRCRSRNTTSGRMSK